MHSVIVFVVLAASGTGGSYSSGRQRQEGGMSSYFASPAQNKPQTALVASKIGQLSALHAERTDVGVGLGSFTLSITVDDVAACSITAACADTGLVSKTDCSGTFDANSVLRLVVTSKDVACAVLPKFTAYATWIW